MRQHAAGRARAGARRRGQHRAVVRRLEEAEAEAAERHRQAMPSALASAGSRLSSASPTASSAMPKAPRAPAGIRSESRPASGAARPSATGQGVIRRPVSTWSRPSTLWK